MMRISRQLSLFVRICVALSVVPASVADSRGNLERSVCGLKEPFMFWLWSKAAGEPSTPSLAASGGVSGFAIQTTDNRTLRGYKVSAGNRAEAVGYLLVAQGNAMLADQIVGAFTEIADAGYDVYVVDYRGYGRSEGKRRLKAILSDYREIKAHLDSLGYARRAFYGLSFGGIVMLDVLKDDRSARKLVIDSAPSKVSDHGCPDTHDPVRNLPDPAADTLIIVGERDTVVKPRDSEALVARARSLGATVLVEREFGHPFMDAKTHRRMELVRSFLNSR